MRRFSQLALAIAWLTAAGCSRRHGADQFEHVVVPGLGVPGIVQVGMTVADVRSHFSDLVVRNWPEVYLPWQDQFYDVGTRLPWEDPSSYTVTIPSLGLVFTGRRQDEPIRHLVFYVAKPVTDKPGTTFTGSLPGGLSFAETNHITKLAVVALFGDPECHLVVTNAATAWTGALSAELGRGRSVSLVDARGESLFYPDRGIRFVLEDDAVQAFVIHAKVKRRPTLEELIGEEAASKVTTRCP